MNIHAFAIFAVIVLIIVIFHHYENRKNNPKLKSISYLLSPLSLMILKSKIYPNRLAEYIIDRLNTTSYAESFELITADDTFDTNKIDWKCRHLLLIIENSNVSMWEKLNYKYLAIIRNNVTLINSYIMVKIK